MLLVDIGNTSIMVKDSESGVRRRAASPAEIAEQCVPGQRVAFSTTRELSSEERAIAEEAGWWEFTSQRPVPLEVEYSGRATLGADRLAAALGASKLRQGATVLVADIGTALTLDLVEEGRRYKGGNISPGIQMRLDAMHSFTSRLPQVEADGRLPQLGEDTETAMRCGAVRGLAAEIAGIMLSLGRNQEGAECREVVATGGGASVIMPLLQEMLPEGCRVSHEPDLVFEGLKRAYNYNHEYDEDDI